MVTKRCVSTSLLNHNFLNWVGTFEFNGKTKKKETISFMSSTEEDIFSFIGNVKRE